MVCLTVAFRKIIAKIESLQRNLKQIVPSCVQQEEKTCGNYTTTTTPPKTPTSTIFNNNENQETIYGDNNDHLSLLKQYLLDKLQSSPPHTKHEATSNDFHSTEEDGYDEEEKYACFKIILAQISYDFHTTATTIIPSRTRRVQAEEYGTLVKLVCETALIASKQNEDEMASQLMSRILSFHDTYKNCHETTNNFFLLKIDSQLESFLYFLAGYFLFGRCLYADSLQYLSLSLDIFDRRSTLQGDSTATTTQEEGGALVQVLENSSSTHCAAEALCYIGLCLLEGNTDSSRYTATSAFERSLSLRKKAGYHTGFCNTMMLLGNALVAKGMLNKALEVYWNTLLIYRKVPEAGSNHTELEVKTHIASLQIRSQSYHSAEKLLNQIISEGSSSASNNKSFSRTPHYPKSKIQGVTLSNMQKRRIKSIFIMEAKLLLAKVYRTTKRYEMAQNLLKEMFQPQSFRQILSPHKIMAKSFSKMFEKVLLEFAITSLDSSRNVETLLQILSDWIVEEKEDRDETVVVEENTKLISMMNMVFLRLSNTLYFSGKYQAFIILQNVIGDLISSLNGPTRYMETTADIEVKANFRAGLGYKKLGIFNKAINCFDRAVAIAMDVFGDSNLQALKLLQVLGQTYMINKNCAEAVNVFREVVEILKARDNREIEDIVTAMYNLGKAYTAIQDYDSAISTYLDAFSENKARDEQRHPPQGPHIHIIPCIHEEMGKNFFCKMQGDSQESHNENARAALLHFREADRLWKNKGISKSIRFTDYARLWSYIACSYCRLGDRESAFTAYYKAISWNRRMGKIDDSNLISDEISESVLAECKQRFVYIISPAA